MLFRSVFEENIDYLENILEDTIHNNGNFDLKDRRFGNIIWPVEEILFLRLLNDGFYEKLPEALSKIFNIPDKISVELVNFQEFTLKKPQNQRTSDVFSFEYLNLSEISFGNISSRPNQNYVYHAKHELDFDSIEDYARQIVWYGRKGSNMKRDIQINLNKALR